MPGPPLSGGPVLAGNGKKPPPAIAALGHLPGEGRLFSGGARKKGSSHCEA